MSTNGKNQNCIVILNIQSVHHQLQHKPSVTLRSLTALSISPFSRLCQINWNTFLSSANVIVREVRYVWWAAAAQWPVTCRLYDVWCAGYAKRYRYCEYFGKYFCLCCHSNDRIHIPGHILRNWNFGKFPVSHFAFELLKRIFDDPLFSIEASSSSVLLYKKEPVLDEVCSCRTQLFHLNAFISTCTRPGR